VNQELVEGYESTVSALWRTLQPSKAREMVLAYAGLIAALKSVVPS